MELLKKGAEANLYKDDFLGYDVMIKKRVQKKYRVPQMDADIRKRRTTSEPRLLSAARAAGVHTPYILNIDQKDTSLYMDYIHGFTVKTIIDTMPEDKMKELCVGIGVDIAKLHAKDIIHGDLTTSNMILSQDKVFFIDFGLGYVSHMMEDKAVDLVVLKKAIQSTHYRNYDKIFAYILEGYRQGSPDAAAILRNMGEIEQRARYSERVG